jgi:hypothetical protein
VIDAEECWHHGDGRAPVVLRRDGARPLHGVLTVSASAEGIHQLLWMLNPEKIGAVA